MIKLATVSAFAFSLLASANVVVANDCATALPVLAADLPVGFVVDTAGMSNLTTVPCANTPSNGPEIWYRLSGLQPGGRYTIRTSAVDSLEDTRIAVFQDSCGPLNLIACTDDVPESGFAFVDLQTLNETSVLVLVEVADPAATGEFQVSFSPYVPANPGDGCENPITMTGGSLPLTLDVNPSELANDRDASCGRGPAGPESWVALPALPDGDYMLETIPIAGSSVTDTRLELFANPICDSLASIACNDDINTSAGNQYSAIRFHSSGESFLAFVEANLFDSNPTIRLRLSAAGTPGHETCGNAVDLTTIALPYRASQNLAGALDNDEGPCGSASDAVDRWYALPPLASGFSYSLRTEGLSVAPNPSTTSLAVYRGACGSLELVTCASGNGGYASAEIVGSDDEQYYAFVEAAPSGGSGSALQFDLVLEEIGGYSPPVNTTCLNATVISASALPFSNVADLRAADIHEAWYSFTPTVSGKYSVVAVTSNRGGRSQLRIMQGGCAVGLADVCGSPFIAQDPIASPSLQAGTAYLISVSAVGEVAALENASIVISGPLTETPALNASCASAEEVATTPYLSQQTITGAGVISIPGGSPCSGELYYSVTPLISGTLVVTASSTDGSPAAIAHVESCATPTILSNGIGVLTIAMTFRESILVAVESTSPMAGQTISVTFTQDAASANDQCDSATVVDALPFSDSADFQMANYEDSVAPCVAAGENRRDLFWQFTPPATGSYRITAAAADDSLDTAIAVLPSGCGTTAFACANDGVGGESLLVNLQGGTNYLIAVTGPPSSSTCACPLVDFTVIAVPASSGADSCASAVVVTPGSLPYSGVVDLRGNAAAGTILSGPSQFYRFTATATGTLRVTAAPQTPALDLGVAIGFGTCSGSSRNTQGVQVAAVADSAGAGAPETASIFLFPGETVTIAVEGHGKTGGIFDTTIDFVPVGDIWILN